jgi:hypothetical protein
MTKPQRKKANKNRVLVRNCKPDRIGGSLVFTAIPFGIIAGWERKEEKEEKDFTKRGLIRKKYSNRKAKDCTKRRGERVGANHTNEQLPVLQHSPSGLSGGKAVMMGEE